MKRKLADAVGVLVVVAACCGLAGCADSPARPPQCSGHAVPINAPAPGAQERRASGGH